MTHKTLKIAIISLLLGTISSISPMGRFIQTVAAKYSNPIYSKAAVFTKGVVRPGATKQYTEKASALDLLLTGKGKIQDSFDAIRDGVKKGIFPSNQELDKLGRHSLVENYWILNQANEQGHTLLKDALENGNFSYASKKFIKALYNRGAALNNRDKYALGDQALLRIHLNLPPKASAFTTVKVLRTFLTKTTNKFKNLEQMTSSEIDTLAEKVRNISGIYSRVEKDLLAQRELERSAKKNTLDWSRVA